MASHDNFGHGILFDVLIYIFDDLSKLKSHNCNTHFCGTAVLNSNRFTIISVCCPYKYICHSYVCLCLRLWWLSVCVYVCVRV